MEASGDVGLRYCHTYVHLTATNVVVRFSIYFASNFVLLIMWASLLVQLLRSAQP